MDKNVINRLFVFSIAEKGDSPVGDKLETDFMKTCMARATTAGDRLKGLVEKDGEIQWQVCGVYKLSSENDPPKKNEDGQIIFTHVTHSFLDTKVPLLLA